MRNGREVTGEIETGREGENSCGKSRRRASRFPRICVSMRVRRRPENCFRVCAVARQINDFALKAAATVGQVTRYRAVISSLKFDTHAIKHHGTVAVCDSICLR